ncbi:MAG: carboxypeptidase regulatory-like domain-containing protein [Bryobacteraceae bacterium]
MSFNKAFLACFALAASIQAQTTMGVITGLVSDATGSIIAGAAVEARNLDTGTTAQTVSSSTGNYVLLSLPIGSYEISVSVAGFKSWKRGPMTVKSSDNIRADVRLEVGSTTERVEVSGEAPPLKTESTEVSTVMENKLVQDLPIAVAGIGGGMRNAFQLMMMMPQVKSGNGESAWDDLQVGGGQQHDFNVSVDGMSVEMGWRNHVGYMNRLTPTLDSIEEFRIDTAAFKAEDSRASGGNISISTKSGTNELHGSLFDYYQSQHLNANTWTNNKFGRPKAVFHRNDYGATVGGPIFIPKVYNGKNKSYFFFSYEGYRFPSTSGVSELTIPLSEMHRGDFSNWTPNAPGVMVPIFDPSTTRVEGNATVRDAFPGNRIPVSRITRLSSAIASYFPAPNAPGVVRNYRTPGTAPRKRIEDAYVTKFDQNFGVKNRLAFTYTQNGEYFLNNYDVAPNDANNWGGSLPYPLAGRQYYQGDQYYGKVARLNDTHLFTPTLVNTLTLGFHRLTHPEHDVTAEPFGQNWGDKLGGAIPNNPFYNQAFPAVRFNNDNYYGWESTKLWDEYHTVFGLDQNLNWIKNSHSFKFGYSAQLMMLNTNNRNRQAGDVFFNRLETARPGDNTGFSGNAYASFLLGAVDNGGFTIPNTQMLRFPYHAFFVQDDWKITPRLTANLGLRYEMNLSVYEKHDRLSYFDPTLANPAANGTPGALRFLGNGSGREGRRNLHEAANGWGPRAGLAYSINNSTVVRAGAGIFYSTVKVPGLAGANNGFTNSPAWSSADQGVTPAFYWDRGFPAWQNPPFIDPGFNAGFGVPWFGSGEIAKLPQTANWNFAVAHSLKNNLVIDVTYTGSKGTHLASDRVNIMQIDPKYASLGALLNRPIDDPAVAAAGFRAPFANFKQLLGGQATLGQALRVFPQYTGVTTGGMMNHSGNSTYHALIVKATKRFSGGLTLLTSYAWSKLLTDADSSEPWIAGVVGAAVGAGAAQNQYNRGTEKSYGVLDYPNMFKVTVSYDMPFGKGKRFVTGGIGGHLLGGWNLSSYAFAQSGYPMGVVDTGFQNNLRAGTPRPNVLSYDWRLPLVGERFDPDKDNFYNRAVFQRRTNPALDPFGNAPRFIGAVRMFPTYRTNLAVNRSFRIKEKIRADLRVDIFDLFNQKTWGRPSSQDLNSTQFGVITGANGNRNIQGGVKFIF